MYETNRPDLTLDEQISWASAKEKTQQLWRDEKRGALANVPFGIFAFTRLNEQLADSAAWTEGSRQDGRDAMGLTKAQPNADLMTAEGFFGPKQFSAMPAAGQHVFTLVPELFGARSRGSVALRSADPHALPIVDCGFLTHSLDVEVLAEACRFGKEIVVDGAGSQGARNDL